MFVQPGVKFDNECRGGALSCVALGDASRTQFLPEVASFVNDQ